MRRRHEVNLTIGELVDYVNENQLDFDYPVQRPDNQWKAIDKSLLIHSAIIDFDIPSIYAVDNRNENDYLYSVIDGKQRSTVLAEYMNDRFKLHANTPKVTYKNEEYDIANCTYSELPAPLQNAIRNYNIRMIYLVNITDDEIFEMFYRLNNGKTLSTQQKVKSKMEMGVALFIRELSQYNFVENKLILTENQRKNSDYESVLIQSMMLIDDEYQLKNFNAKEIAVYIDLLNSKKDEYLNDIRATIDYLDEVYTIHDGSIELKKMNAPMVIAVANKYKNELSPNEFRMWTISFANDIQKEGSPYQEFTLKSTTNKGNVEGRYNFALNHIKKHVNSIKVASAV